MSCLLHTPSLDLDRTQPNRRQILQQWVSTGNTSRPSEYIITHRATFVPTPGKEVRNVSHSSLFIICSGASVTFPNWAWMPRQIFRMALDFVGDNPPGFSTFAMVLALADAKSSKRGNAQRRAAKVRR
jgi:hypothetical protein